MSCGPVPVPLIVVYVSMLSSISKFDVAFRVWFNSLPTSLPYLPGVLWNNAGTLAKS